MTALIPISVILAVLVVGWFFRPSTPWIKECDKLGAGRRRLRRAGRKEVK